MPRTTRFAPTAVLVACATVARAADAQNVAGRQWLPTDSIHAESVPLSLRAAATARSLGVDVWTITSAEIASSGASSLVELLQARVPGLSVLRQGSITGQAATIRMRGPVSGYFETQPLIVVDGVPLEFARQTAGLNGAVRFSRLDAVSLDEIDRIDILRGPSAGAMFGAGSAAGIIAITTMRARSGPLRVRSRLDAGVTSDHGEYPSNYASSGINPISGQPAARCTIVDQAHNLCLPARLDRWNPLIQASPFRSGSDLSGSTSASGVLGATGIATALGAHARRVAGVTPDEQLTRSGTDLDLARAIGRAMTVGGTITYDRDRARLPTRGNVALPENAILSGLLGSATDNQSHGYVYGLPSFDAVPHESEQVGLYGRLHWQVTPGLEISANGGRFRLAEREQDLRAATDYRDASRMLSGNVGATAALASRALGLGITSLVGYDDRRQRTTERYNAEVPGSQLSSESYDAAWGRQRYLTWQERVSWRDSLFVNIGGTWNADGVFKELSHKPFYSVDVSWLLPPLGGVTGLRLRAARGEAGADANLASDASLQFGFVDFPPPRSVLDRERTRQTDLGLDASVWRGSASLTYYRSLTNHAVLPVPIATNVGYATVPREAATLRSAGVEAALRQQLVSSPLVGWNVVATIATIRTRLADMSLPPFYIGNFSIAQAGYDPHSFWSRPLSYRDANGDGLIDTSEVQVSATVQHQGAATPTLEASLRSTFSHGRWSLGAAIDHRGGFYSLNANEMRRCAIGVCRGMQDPTASLADQARAVSMLKPAADGGGFVENGAYVRLSELALRWGPTADRSASKPVDRLAVSLIAKDAGLWTGYSGLDPEIAAAGADFGQSPMPFRLVLRVELGAPVP